jgi:hypothetical protein
VSEWNCGLQERIWSEWRRLCWFCSRLSCAGFAGGGGVGGVVNENANESGHACHHELGVGGAWVCVQRAGARQPIFGRSLVLRRQRPLPVLTGCRQALIFLFPSRQSSGSGRHGTRTPLVMGALSTAVPLCF